MLANAFIILGFPLPEERTWSGTLSKFGNQLILQKDRIKGNPSIQYTTEKCLGFTTEKKEGMMGGKKKEGVGEGEREQEND